MKVFKFGGASVNSADAVRNMAHIVQTHLEAEPLVVVVSAMGKTTNLLEKLVPGGSGEWRVESGEWRVESGEWRVESGEWRVESGERRAESGEWRVESGERRVESGELRAQLETYHRDIATALMPGDKDVQAAIDSLLAGLDAGIDSLTPDADHYNYNYDQVVSYGELLSTTIIARYLNHRGIGTQWVDARQVVVTDNHYREGRVDWDATGARVAALRERMGAGQVVLTQGFIGGNGRATTTLGREGSDYSAAILAYCLGAASVTIWKDVPGFLNADPKFFADTVKIARIPYNEAIELAYYGASVIHPKTVKPLQNKGIPLYIRSFVTPESEGSAIGNYNAISPATPLYIFRNDQILLSIMPRDYSFIAEDNLQVIFGLLNEVGVRVNMMQNSALSFSICIDNNEQRVGLLIERLGSLFRVRYNDNLQLVTIRYYTQEVIDRIVAGRKVLLEQRSRLTEQLILPGV